MQKQKYYAHPQNQFWRPMGEIYGAGPNLPYDDRLTILKGKGVAVWDVLQNCIREGSMDSDIKHATPNDFYAFFRDHSTIRLVVFDSAKSKEIFQKTQGDFPQITFCRVPSPSPTHARLRYAEKLILWREALLRLE